MALSPGRRLGTYEIVAPLGAGGMGEVYSARDVRLGRRVAIKVLPADVASDRERLKRFEQEARAASSLNHPNIVTVYEAGEADSIFFIAHELVEGKTLSEILAGGALPSKKLLDLATQIADGLAAAHDAGIVHRDLKPGNVMVSREGFVKILDFGLAKLAPPPVGTAQTGAPTTASLGTRPGEVLGTVGYMSPEQASGETVDFQSDQFSFGSLLYEMATGQRAFRGKTNIDTLAAILNEEPEPIARVRPTVPGPLRWLIERCLAKDPADRYKSTRDLANEIKALKEHLPEVAEERLSPRGGSRARRVVTLAALLAALVLGAAIWSLVRASARNPAELDFRRLTFQNGIVSRALFVPNSKSILYTASWGGEPPGSFLAHPDSPGFDRRLESGAQLPFGFSADGSQVLVLLGTTRTAIDIQGMLAWWPAAGGKPRLILDGSGWADWASRTHTLAVVRDTGVERVLELRRETGATKVLFRTRGTMSWVRFSPDEKKIAFIHHPSRLDDAGEVELVTLDGRPAVALTPRFERCVGLDWNARTGEIWFTGARATAYNITLWAVTSVGKLRSLYVLPDFFVLQSVAASGDTCLLIQSENRVRLIIRRASGPPADSSWLGFTMVGDISPDGKTILFSDEGASGKEAGVWVRPLAGGDATALGPGYMGRFSPDGKWVVAVTQARSGPLQLELIPVGPGSARQLTDSTANHWLPSFAGPDALLYASSEGGKNGIWRMELATRRARSLGAEDCEQPMSHPSLTEFLCFCGDQKDVLFVYPMARGAGRKLYDLKGKARFNYARWNGAGDRIFAVTGDRQFLTLDGRSGTLLREETLPLPEAGAYGTFYGAAFDSEASAQAYSVARASSGLYLSTGIR